MKTLRIGTIVAALSLLALPARAADIGLMGGDFDPFPINDPSVFGFGDCNNGSGPSTNDTYFDNYRCVFYHFADLDGNESLDSIASIEFFLFGLSGFEFDVDPRSDLQGFGGDTLVANALRLFTNNGNIVPNFCDGDYDYYECERVTALVLFIGPSEGDPGPLPPWQTRHG